MEQSPLHGDNQQESSRQIRLGWLAGILDGEGTVTIRIRNRRNKSDLLTPVVTVANTDKEIIDRILEIYKENNIPYWVTYYPQKGNWAGSWRVDTVGIKRCIRILNVIKEFLVGKKFEADLVYGWCTNRKDTLGKRKYYDESDLEVVRQLKALHGHKLVLKSSETIR